MNTANKIQLPLLPESKPETRSFDNETNPIWFSRRSGKKYSAKHVEKIPGTKWHNTMAWGCMGI